MSGSQGLGLAIGLSAGLATCIGGLAALRLRDPPPGFLGFSSGAVLGVALFDLLPGALGAGGAAFSPLTLLAAAGVGMTLYFALDRAALALGGASGRWRAHFGPASLTAHSLMDGLGIGLTLQASTALGVIVAVAVLAHDLVDGANTVMLGFAGGADARLARRWLAADAAAPLVGVTLARLFSVPTDILAVLLAVFAGFFLYIGAAELLPRTRAASRPGVSLAAFALGLGFVYLVVRLAG